MHYLFDLYGRFAGTSEIATDRSTEIAPAQESQDWNWNGIAWVYVPNVQTQSTVAPAPLPVAITKLTKLEYMNRFTDTELAGIYTAAKVSIDVEVWLEKFKLATEIDLTDERTIAGLRTLEAAGLLVEGRAAEILTP